MFYMYLEPTPIDVCPICKQQIATFAETIAITQSEEWLAFAHKRCCKVLRGAINELVAIER